MTDASGNSLAAGKEETRADCNKLPGPNRNGCGLLQARPAAQGLTQGSLRSPLARAGQGQERPPPHLPWLHPSPSLPVVTSGASRSRPGSSPSPVSPVGAPLLITCSALNRCSAGCSCVEAPGRPQGRFCITSRAFLSHSKGINSIAICQDYSLFCLRLQPSDQGTN